MKLDEIHHRMIDLLRHDGRLSVNTLAVQLGISRSNAYQRLERLVDSGVITGFSAQVDPRAVGLGIAAMVFVTVEQNRWDEFRSSIGEIDGLEYFGAIAGEHDAMLLVRATDVAELHQLVSGQLAKWRCIRSTETVFLLDEARSLAAIPVGPTVAPSTDVIDPHAPGKTRIVRNRPR
ncbi:Transcriptional regulator, AsnC family [Microbacterium esteraromaticum]|uniref:Transcriptional regulator, AsnC family n=1 Tax=Microbacterium esteraromaticum TaxID=57043 RepID=A0A1R4IN55_9MICO|nr:Lrp/AsnC family transcriptional regulator [Microbacterium esteraromaticum]SJN21292.1 Transcriptional regulator, AsnC family [Microbacterium esteraromaticum]